MNKFSNMLKIPTFSDLYKEMLNKIARKSKAMDPNFDVPMFVTTSDSKFEEFMLDSPTNWGVTVQYESYGHKLKSINDLNDRVVLHLNVMNVYPKSVYDFVSLLCLKCQISSSTKDADDYVDDIFTCKFCKTEASGKLYFNVEMLCRENVYSNKLITLYLSSYDDEGVNFFGISPVDLFRNSTDYQKLENIVSLTALFQLLWRLLKLEILKQT